MPTQPCDSRVSAQASLTLMLGSLITSLGQRAGAFVWSAQHQADQESFGLDLLIGTVTASEHSSSSSRFYYFAKG